MQGRGHNRAEESGKLSHTALPFHICFITRPRIRTRTLVITRRNPRYKTRILITYFYQQKVIATWLSSRELPFGANLHISNCLNFQPNVCHYYFCISIRTTHHKIATIQFIRSEQWEDRARERKTCIDRIFTEETIHTFKSSMG